MSGEPACGHAIEAVKAGALDYRTKPFDFERLRGLLVVSLARSSWPSACGDSIVGPQPSA